MKRFSAPDLIEQLEAFRLYCEWATDCKIAWRDSNSVTSVRAANEVWGELLFRGSKALGTDEIRNIDLEVGDTPRQECLGGYRVLNIQLNMRSRSQDPSSANVGWYAAEMARSKIAYVYANTRFFCPCEMSFASAENLVNMPVTAEYDHRIEDVAVVEFFMNALIVDADSAAAGTYIEAVELSSDLKDAGRVSLDASLQLTDEVIP